MIPTKHIRGIIINPVEFICQFFLRILLVLWSFLLTPNQAYVIEKEAIIWAQLVCLCMPVTVTNASPSRYQKLERRANIVIPKMMKKFFGTFSRCGPANGNP